MPRRRVTALDSGEMEDRVVKSLALEPSIFQGEIISMQNYVEDIVNSSLEGGLVDILSNSQAVLGALQAVRIESEVVFSRTIGGISQCYVEISAKPL